MKTLKLRIKDKHAKVLNQMASEVNFVWNYVNDLGFKHLKKTGQFLSAFDIAMMPFALNDATKFISPTKTLEYMAAEKPIISTRIKDVERDYQHCVSLIDNAAEFCAAIEAVALEREEQIASYKEILSNTSWDNTAQNMKSIIKEAAL